MRFRFPIVIIDEDFRSENTSGSGIRELASAIEGHGMEVIGYTSYGDLTAFAQQQSRAAGFILSIDDEEFHTADSTDAALGKLYGFVAEIRRRNADKRGGEAERVELTGIQDETPDADPAGAWDARRADVTYDDIGGMAATIDQLREMVERDRAERRRREPRIGGMRW